ncbi:MAG TPA: hypothetical protein VEZ11_11120 [Thermoanaerobaculia bacterium]|nr:hypothetical protein [Thermoanaerobaculia bacterium]
MNCPKCGFEQSDHAVECVRCGIVFAKWQESEELALLAKHRPPADAVAAEEAVANGRIGRKELQILGGGLAAAAIVYAFPLTRFLFSALVTLFHELGHAVVGWLLGYPSLPAFDFVYGGGFTHQGTFHLPIALAVAAAFGYGGWLFRENRVSVALIAVLLVGWLFFVTAEWRRELAIAAAGHAFELILAGIFFYQALSGVGWRVPEVERPLGAFAAFFVQIHSMMFAWRLIHDPDFLAWYREGKGGALMNDLEVVALDVNIYGRLNPGIEGVARWLLVFSIVPMGIALLWYFQRARWHRMLRALRTAR